jgi:hypothetical protein
VLVRVTDVRVQRDRGRHAGSFECQSALGWDPVSAPKRAPFERGVLALDLKSDLSNLLDEAPWPADIKSAGNVVSTGQTREQAESGDGVGACDRSWPFCDVAADTPDVRLSM